MFLMEAQHGDSKIVESNERQLSSAAMATAAVSMRDFRTTLWQRGVADEAVALLPTRIAYPLLEKATGVVNRSAMCGDQALLMLAATINSTESALSTITAALMDLMHSYEHMAALVSELCCMVSEQPVNRLAVELLREFGRLDGSSDSKASGVKNVAGFLSALAVKRPRLVLQQMSHILPHLASESYPLRSAIVSSAASILEYLGKQQQEEPSSVVDSDDEMASPAPMDTAKSREALLDILAERVYDVSSFTRAAALKAWVSLVSSSTMPKERLLAVTKLALDRLQDKTVAVRKQSMLLLTTMLENNPFMGSLDPKPYHEKLKELYSYVKDNLPETIKETHEASLKEAIENGEDKVTIFSLEQAALAAAIGEADSWVAESADDLSESQQVYCGKVQALKFTQSALDFIDLFEGATVALEGMLLSANTSDVTEALRFFVQARHFQLPVAVTGMKRALALMWSSEQSIRDEVLKAFVDVFIAEPGTEGALLLPDNVIAKNLLVLTGQAAVSELASIEAAMKRLVKEERIPPNVFLMLWSIASKGSADARVAALRLLSMGAGADRSIVDSKSRLKLLLDAGLGEYTQERRDWRLAAAAADALQRIGRAKFDLSDAKYLVLERIMEELCAVARGDWCDDNKREDTLQWFPAAEQAVKALFVICPEPEKACQEIIIGMYQTTFKADPSTCHSLRLARFCHVLGQIALNLLVYTESLSGSVRRANAMKSLKKQEDADKAKSTRNSRSEEDDAIEAELGVAAEVEAENERKMAEISEKEILGRGLIGTFAPLLVRVISNEGGHFNSEILTQSSTLALCKFMCVSSEFCEKHLPLLFTTLANAHDEDTTMRANTVVALGDLAFRFPNEVEPYTPRLYACLRDSSTKVRRHTLMVLTHLILNDMVKVKGQVCEIAMCLRDNDPRIRDMSRLLFHELSKRSNNPIYNLLPDIISQLSQMSIAKDDFRGILSFLLGYIKKEKQNEMLTDKLCQRFPKAESIEQKADLSYCIAQLKMNEKTIRSLSEHFKLYKDALYDEDVKKNFMSIVTKAKKFSKPEARQFVDEWEAKLNESAEVSAENQATGEKAAKARARASKRAARKAKIIAPVIEEGDEEEEEAVAAEAENELSFTEKENTPVVTKRTSRSRRGRRAAVSP